MSTLYISQALLWAMVMGLSALVFALARQIGILHERIAPVGALMTGGGPVVGSRAPKIVTRLLDGRTLKVGEPLAVGQTQLLLFISAQCPICKKIISLAKSVAKAEQVDVVFVGDADAAEQHALVSAHELQAYPFVNGPELGMAFQVDKLPFGVVLDENGKVAAKGLVNSREHLESLMIAKSTGFASVQAYVRRRADLEVENL